MSTHIRPVRPAEVARTWRTLSSVHPVGGRAEFERLCESDPNLVRVSDKGDVAVLGAWREHLDVLAIKVIRARAAAIGPMVDDARRLSETRGYASVLSPLTARSQSAPYVEAGMGELVRLRAFTRSVDRTDSGVPPQAHIRLATADDLATLVAVDARCFEPFWRYGPREMAHALLSERVTVCQDADGASVGYAACALNGASVTVGRLAVDPKCRRRGFGAALLDEALGWSRTTNALGVSLCTQQENESARRLYLDRGFQELDEEYLLFAADARGA